MTGTVIKSIADFYYVETETGIRECKARGIFKKQGRSPLVGDEVDISVTGDGEGVLEEIRPRRNSFIRPPVANVECFAVITACTAPRPNLPIIDRFLVMAEMNGADIVLGINKCDLADEKTVKELEGIYSGIYRVIPMSAVTGAGMEELSAAIENKRTVFAGPSGAGKSSIINLLHPGAGAETGGISPRTGRGRHTTRHVEMFKYRGGYIFDTPGFSAFDMPEADEERLDSYYPEMVPYKGRCRFDDCRHIDEPGCAVKEAVERGAIGGSRYGSYREQMKELHGRKEYR